jgi:hypothetical protein
MKNLLNLKGTQVLSKENKKAIIGGGIIYMICAPEPPICSEGNLDCERELIQYNIHCVNR